jgi:hypothetical protein
MASGPPSDWNGRSERLRLRRAAGAISRRERKNLGWQEYAIVPGASAFKILPGRPLTDYLSVLGGTGITAYFGLLELEVRS